MLQQCRKDTGGQHEQTQPGRFHPILWPMVLQGLMHMTSSHPARCVGQPAGAHPVCRRLQITRVDRLCILPAKAPCVCGSASHARVSVAVCHNITTPCDASTTQHVHCGGNRQGVVVRAHNVLNRGNEVIERCNNGC